jgi:adenylate cyclase
MERRLSAILAADMVGYSRLMQVDEVGTLDRIKKYRAKLIDPLFAKYDGRIVKEIGDGILVEFASAVNAVSCGIEIQKAIPEIEADLPSDQRISYRIGINLGDIIVEGDDIYGDGINVASRIETICPEGGVCVSANIMAQLSGKIKEFFAFAGKHKLKNIESPVEIWCWPKNSKSKIKRTQQKRISPLIPTLAALVFALAIGLFYWLSPSEEMSANKRQPSLVVLPFDNLGGSPEQDYFSDGITEDLTTDISRIGGIFVLARHTAFKFEDRRGIDIRDIGRELDVDYVLEGSVRKYSDRIRVNAQLIDAVTGNHVWANRFDRELNDVFIIQDDIAKEIVSALTIKLSDRENTLLSSHRTVDPTAYDLFLRGLSMFRRFDPESNEAARQMFHAAAGIDPSFARAIADIGLSHGIDLLFNWTDDPEESIRLATKYSTLANRIDPSIREVHFAMSTVNLSQKKLPEAIKATDEAILIDPNYADAYAQRAQALAFSGKASEARASLEQAKRLNPLYPFYYTWIDSLIYFTEAEYSNAIKISKDVALRNPAFTGARLILAASYGLSGQLDKATWEVAELLTQDPDLTLDKAVERAPFMNEAHLSNYTKGLGLAGLE